MRFQDGTCLTYPKDIHLAAVNYFSGFLQEESRRSLPDLSQLISPIISMAESGAIFAIPSID